MSTCKKDTAIILVISTIFAIAYILFEGRIMEYGREISNPLILRCLPVFLIQFGMSCLGPLVVILKNKEKLTNYGFLKRNTLRSVIGCLICSLPTIVFLGMTNEIHGFLPFQGMFLTKDILAATFGVNVLGYTLIAVIWGLGEGLFYVVLADKINAIRRPHGLWNLGAFTGALIAILIHGMIGFSIESIAEMLATFILMYGSLIIREKTGNAWGNILIFFIVWNAL